MFTRDGAGARIAPTADRRGLWRIWSAGVVVVLVAAAPAWAQRATVPAEVRATTDFLLLAYPDLLSRPVAITANRQGRTVAVRVDEPAAPGTAREAATTEPLLAAAVEWADTGEIVSFAAQGLLVETARNAALAEQMHLHADWTDADAAAAMRAMGGRAAAPEGQAVADAAKLARHLGAVPAVSGLGLRWRDAAGAPFVGTPGWVMTAQVTKRDAATVGYQFTFEPFAGRLVMVTRQ